MKTTIVPLDKTILRQQLAVLLRLDADTDGEHWSGEHFLLDLPGKWECSRVAFDTAGQVAGFVIASVRGESLHLHRLVVSRLQRRGGLGTRLLLAMAQAAQRRGLPTISLKLARTNTGARRFYERLGFLVHASGPRNLGARVETAELRQNAGGAALAAIQGDDPA